MSSTNNALCPHLWTMVANSATSVGDFLATALAFPTDLFDPSLGVSLANFVVKNRDNIYKHEVEATAWDFVNRATLGPN